MTLLRKLPPFLRNKYFLAAGFFVVWMLFFDRNDFFTMLERRKELRDLEKGKQYYSKEIAENKKFTIDMKSNPFAIEKFARERYLMKRDNEDLFLLQKAAKE